MSSPKKNKFFSIPELGLGNKFKELNDNVKNNFETVKTNRNKMGEDGKKLQERLNTRVSENFEKAKTGITYGLDKIGAIPGVTDLKDITKFGVYTLPTTILSDLKKTNQNTFSINIFEKQFKSFGKTLDQYMEEIAFEQNTNKNAVIDNEHIVVRNEILTVFQKSKLNPDQLAALIMSNNIYIENEKPGDWTRLQSQEVEEEMYNMKHEPGYIEKDKKDILRDPIEIHRNPKEQSFLYTKQIKQNFD